MLKLTNVTNLEWVSATGKGESYIEREDAEAGETTADGRTMETQAEKEKEHCGQSDSPRGWVCMCACAELVMIKSQNERHTRERAERPAAIMAAVVTLLVSASKRSSGTHANKHILHSDKHVNLVNFLLERSLFPMRWCDLQQRKWSKRTRRKRYKNKITITMSTKMRHWDSGSSVV